MNGVLKVWVEFIYGPDAPIEVLHPTLRKSAKDGAPDRSRCVKCRVGHPATRPSTFILLPRHLEVNLSSSRGRRLFQST